MKKILFKVFHYPSIVILALIWLIFSYIAIDQFYNAIIHLINSLDVRFFLEEVFIVFLFIELIAAIKIYFKENYHFPLRFFIYMGITDLVRHIIIFNKDWKQTFYFALSIIVLVACLALMDYKNKVLRKELEKESEKSFEL